MRWRATASNLIVGGLRLRGLSTSTRPPSSDTRTATGGRTASAVKLARDETRIGDEAVCSCPISASAPAVSLAWGD